MCETSQNYNMKWKHKITCISEQAKWHYTIKQFNVKHGLKVSNLEHIKLPVNVRFRYLDYLRESRQSYCEATVLILAHNYRVAQ